MTVKLTKKAALTVFKEEMALAKQGGGWNYGDKDSVAKREAWNVYTDSMCKDGLITERQYETWSNPF